jgi:carboxylesterase
VRAPALILHAREDDQAGPRSVQELQRKLRRWRSHWFDDSYAKLTLDNERAAVGETVVDFLQQQLPLPLAAAA